MTTLGQLCLLAAFVGSGYAAFAGLAGWQTQNRLLRRAAAGSAIAAVFALTAVAAILAWALSVRDFRFVYVAQYSSRLLPWYYSLSAFWVGQAGSLLLWAWLLGLLAAAYRFWPRRRPSPLCEPAGAILMAYLCFLVAIMVFAADPMQPSLAVAGEGDGLSPLLQHPAMLLHPPVVFLGYAGWAIPFALAAAAALAGRWDAAWASAARPWALFSWAVLGIGILLGADWAYEELGWGGYWAWDPVENGSLVPWLTGTALIHCLMAWRYRGVFKRTAVALAVATFAACNFAAFLTRSGVFGGLHAFSQSPIGWMFLLLMAALAVAAVAVLVRQRKALAPERPIATLWAREAVVGLLVLALSLLAVAVFLGTLSVPLADVLLGKKIVVGSGFYNQVLLPTGLSVLAATAVVPLLRWGGAPTPSQKRVLGLAGLCGGLAAAAGYAAGFDRGPMLAVFALAATALAAVVGGCTLDVLRQNGSGSLGRFIDTFRAGRRRYAGYVIHLGFVCLAIGVTGSSSGTPDHEATLRPGETLQWAGQTIRFNRLVQSRQPDKWIVQAELEVTPDGTDAYTLLPAQQFHLLQNEWTCEVAIHSSWRRDLYTILHRGEGEDGIRLTCVENPMMRWLWLSGWIGGVGALLGLWPARRERGQSLDFSVRHAAGH